MAVLAALLGFCHLAAGFTNQQLVELVGALLDIPTAPARPPTTCAGSPARG
jgi:hypothetical protein